MVLTDSERNALIQQLSSTICKGSLADCKKLLETQRLPNHAGNTIGNEMFECLTTALMELNAQGISGAPDVMLYMQVQLSQHAYCHLSGDCSNKRTLSTWQELLQSLLDHWSVIKDRRVTIVNDAVLQRLTQIHNNLYMLQNYSWLKHLPMFPLVTCLASFIAIYRHNEEFEAFKLVLNPPDVLRMVGAVCANVAHVASVLQHVQHELSELYATLQQKYFPVTQKGKIKNQPPTIDNNNEEIAKQELEIALKRMENLKSLATVSNEILKGLSKRTKFESVFERLINLRPRTEFEECFDVAFPVERQTLRLLQLKFNMVQQLRSIGKMLHYLNMVCELDSSMVDNQPKFVKLYCITRLLQVLGESLKNTKQSPNMPASMLLLLKQMLNQIFSENVKSLREYYSHEFSLEKFLRNPVEEQLFTNVMNFYDLRAGCQIFYILTAYDCVKMFCATIQHCQSMEDIRRYFQFLGSTAGIEKRLTELCEAAYSFLELHHTESPDNHPNDRASLRCLTDLRKLLGRLREFYRSVHFIPLEHVQCAAHKRSLQTVKRLTVWKLQQLHATDFYNNLHYIFHHFTECLDITAQVQHMHNIRSSVNDSDMLETRSILQEILNGPVDSIEPTVIEELNEKLQIYYADVFCVDRKYKVLRKFLQTNACFSCDEQRLIEMSQRDQQHLQRFFDERRAALSNVLRHYHCDTIDRFVENYAAVPGYAIAAMEQWQLELCVILASVGHFGDNSIFLRHRLPIIQGRNYRNYLAHDSLCYRVFADCHWVTMVNAFVMANTPIDLFRSSGRQFVYGMHFHTPIIEHPQRCNQVKQLDNVTTVEMAVLCRFPMDYVADLLANQSKISLRCLQYAMLGATVKDAYLAQLISTGKLAHIPIHQILQAAVTFGKPHVVTQLITGSLFTIADLLEHVQDYICCAAIYGHHSMIRYLVNIAGPSLDPTSLTTATIKMIQKEAWACVRLLIDCGVAIDFPQHMEYTALVTTPFLELLMRNNMNLIRKLPTVRPENYHRHRTSRHPITIALRTRNDRMIKLLRQLGFRYLDSSDTLHWAIIENLVVVQDEIFATLANLKETLMKIDHVPYATIIQRLLINWFTLGYLQEPSTDGHLALTFAVTEKNVKLVEKLLNLLKELRVIDDLGVLNEIVFQYEGNMSVYSTTSNRIFSTMLEQCQIMLSYIDALAASKSSEWQLLIFALPHAKLEMAVFDGNGDTQIPVTNDNLQVDSINSTIHSLLSLCSDHANVFVTIEKRPCGTKYFFLKTNKLACVLDLLPVDHAPADGKHFISYQSTYVTCPLWDCVARWNATICNLLLKNGADPLTPAPDLRNRTPLHHAVEINTEAALMFIDHVGVNDVLEMTSVSDQTVLSHAAHAKEDTVLRYLLDRGVNLRAKAHHFLTAAVDCVLLNKPKRLQLFLDRIPELLDMQDENGFTMLHYSARSSVDSLGVLLPLQPNFALRVVSNYMSYTAVELAAHCQNVRWLKMVCAHFNKENKFYSVTVGEYRDICSLAKQLEDEELLKLAMVPLKTIEDKLKEEVVDWITLVECQPCTMFVSVLLKFVTLATLGMAWSHDKTPLHYAVELESVVLVEKLLQIERKARTVDASKLLSKIVFLRNEEMLEFDIHDKPNFVNLLQCSQEFIEHLDTSKQWHIEYSKHTNGDTHRSLSNELQGLLQAYSEYSQMCVIIQSAERKLCFWKSDERAIIFDLLPLTVATQPTSIVGSDDILFDCITRWNADICKLLLNAGADPTKLIPQQGLAPVHCAVASANRNALDMLLDHCDQGMALSLPSQSGKQLIHFAAYASDDEMMGYLLAKGVDAQAQDENGWTAAMYCVELNQLTRLGILLDHDPSLLELCDNNGWTLLHLSTRFSVDTLTVLLPRKPNFGALEYVDQRTPVEVAAKRKNLQWLKEVLTFLNSNGEYVQTMSEHVAICSQALFQNDRKLLELAFAHKRRFMQQTVTSNTPG